jgi:hypothetical protein
MFSWTIIIQLYGSRNGKGAACKRLQSSLTKAPCCQHCTGTPKAKKARSNSAAVIRRSSTLATACDFGGKSMHYRRSAGGVLAYPSSELRSHALQDILLLKTAESNSANDCDLVNLLLVKVLLTRVPNKGPLAASAATAADAAAGRSSWKPLRLATDAIDQT